MQTTEDLIHEFDEAMEAMDRDWDEMEARFESERKARAYTSEQDSR